MAEETLQDDPFNPLLGRMLGIQDPTKMNLTLSQIGRKALGADTEEYQKRKAEVDAARTAMTAALQERKNRFDPTMLALAQGFLAPTRTGSFGESLGMAVKGYGEAQQAEMERAAQLAKMRYELARSGLSEEQEAAKLGLSVMGKLSPKLTNLQQQVRSEGMDPLSPQGQARVRELYQLSQATPEMKEFSARSGVALTDPTFSTKFTQSRNLEPLRPIATRLGLDLNNPDDVLKAQQQLQRETFRTQNPDVAKRLDEFGGDPLNPKDVERATKLVAADANLERTGKRTTIAQQQANTMRTNQEISDHIRDGNFAVLPEYARQVGVPIQPKNPYAGMNRIEATKKREEDLKSSEKYINDKVAPFMSGIDTDITNLTRAQQLNTELATGQVYGVPVVGTAAKLLSGDKAKFDELDSLSALAAKANRIPGDSNVSNIDVQMMRLGTFSSDKQPAANKVIIEFLLEQRKRDRDYNEYLQNYAAVNGQIGPHAQAEWRRYLEANPITRKNPQTGRVELNPDRMSYQQFYTAPRVLIGKDGKLKQ